VWVAAGTSGGTLALLGTLIASLVAVLTSIGTIIANRAARARAKAEAQAALAHADVDTSRLSLDGLLAYADRLEKENVRLRADLVDRDTEVEELRDLRELIESLKGRQR
jgi:hydroxypyruvate isomerase